MRVVVGMSGASGAVYGVRLLERLRERGDVESHLVATKPAEKTLHQETGMLLNDLKGLADVWHPNEAIGATIASGSFLARGMVIAPCSMNTLAAMAHGICDNLLTRAADVMLKERRRLILMVRETPFHLGHLRSMTAVTEMGGIVAPPLPAFYTKPESVDDIVDQSVGRVMDLLDLDDPRTLRWEGC